MATLEEKERLAEQSNGEAASVPTGLNKRTKRGTGKENSLESHSSLAQSFESLKKRSPMVEKANSALQSRLTKSPLIRSA